MSDLDTLVGLVSHYSPSGQERGVVEWLVKRMMSLGYHNVFMDAAGNAVGIMGRGPRQIVLLGHIDTVPGEIPVRQEGMSPQEVLYGRGTVDAKGPLACFVDAVAQVGERAGWQLIVIGAVEEERDSAGARFVATQYKPEFAIIGEPNQWNRIALGYKGSAWANITVKRGQVHPASGAETSAEAAVDLWLKLKAYIDAFNTDRPKAFDKLLIHLLGIRSDANGFEEWTQLNVGVRLPVDLLPDAWYESLREIANDAIVEPVGFAIPAWRCEKNTRLVRVFLSAIRSIGREPAFVYKTGTADLNIIAPAWKCPALVYGPGDSALDHTPNEHIALEDYTNSVRVLGKALIHLMMDEH